MVKDNGQMKAYWDYAYKEIKEITDKHGVHFPNGFLPKDRNAIDTSNFVKSTHLFFRINSRPLSVVAGIWIKSDDKKLCHRILDCLMFHKEEIENNISLPNKCIKRDKKAGKEDSSLEFYLYDVDYRKKEDWANIKHFHVDMANKICKYIIEPYKDEIEMAINNKFNIKEYTKKVTNEFNKIENDLDNNKLTGKEKEAIVKVRVNQSIFRKQLMNRYSKCVLCGIENPKLLVASHIKPWKDCLPNEKVDLNNGFLFCLNHDGLFDKGLITFDDNGYLKISNNLSKNDKLLLNIENKKINLNKENIKYLKYHRENIYKK